MSLKFMGPLPQHYTARRTLNGFASVSSVHVSMRSGGSDACAPRKFFLAVPRELSNFAATCYATRRQDYWNSTTYSPPAKLVATLDGFLCHVGRASDIYSFRHHIQRFALGTEAAHAADCWRVLPTNPEVARG